MRRFPVEAPVELAADVPDQTGGAIAPAYAAWGHLLEHVLLEEAQRVSRLAVLPLPDPRCGDTEQFLAALLAPVRSGIILTRADLARAARTLDLGLQIGERAFMLKALFSQDPGRTLDWIANEAAGWKAHHTARRDMLGEIALFWATRAAATIELLHPLRDEVGVSHV